MQAVDLEPEAGVALHGLALSILHQNRSQDAAAILLTVRRQHPEQLRVHVDLAEAQFAAGRFKEARDAAEQAIQVGPDSVDAHLALLLPQLRLGDYDSALRAISRVRDKHPKPAWDCLDVLLHVELKDLEMAASMLPGCQASERQALVKDAQLALAHATGDAAVAEKLAADDSTVVLRASRAAEEGDCPRAVAILDPLVARHPEDLGARVLRGSCHYYLGHRDAAKADLEMALTGEMWVKVNQDGVVSGVVTKSMEQALERAVVDAAALLIVVYVEGDELDLAKATLARVRERYGPVAPLLAAEGRLRVVSDVPGGWASIAAAIEAEGGAGSPVVRKIAGEMAYAHAEQMPDAVKTWLASVDWRGAFNAAAGQANLGDFAGCVKTAAASLEAPIPARGRLRLLPVGYGCAAMGEDLPHADAWFDAAGEIPLGPQDVLNHVALLLGEERFERAQTVLSSVQHSPEDPSTPRRARQLQLAVYLGGGKIDEALELADETADPQMLLGLGYQLMIKNELVDAEDVLDMACPRLQGEAAANCATLLEQVEQRLDAAQVIEQK